MHLSPNLHHVAVYVDGRSQVADLVLQGKSLAPNPVLLGRKIGVLALEITESPFDPDDEVVVHVPIVRLGGRPTPLDPMVASESPSCSISLSVVDARAAVTRSRCVSAP